MTTTPLGRRYLDAGGRWAPGMATAAERVIDVVYDAKGHLAELLLDLGGKGCPECCDEVPDLTDAATLGCVLACVRDAFLAPRTDDLDARLVFVGWLSGEYVRAVAEGREGEALVAALEARAGKGVG
jgi:hypothetical protein